jgi:hypothetical protein
MYNLTFIILEGIRRRIVQRVERNLGGVAE